MDAGVFSCGVFINLKKAFDTVHHSILIHRLDFYGFGGIINVWFRSYLQDRTQITYLLLTDFEGRTVSYGPSFFLLDLWPKREARGPYIEGEKTRIRNLQYGPRKRG